MNAARTVICLLLAAALCGIARGEDKKPAAKDAARVVVVSQPGLVRGRTNKLILRGVNLDQVTSARVDGGSPPQGGEEPATQPASQPASIAALAVRVISKAKSDPPRPFEAPRAGDSQIELEVDVPQSQEPASVTLVLETATGQAKTPPLAVLDERDVIDEHEPNNGFREAQAVEIGKIIRGAIQAPGDVDVFRFDGRAGQKMQIEVLAARAGSLLDSTLSLYDSRGRLLFSNDDSELGSDSLLTVTLPADGVYFVSLADANDTGSGLHGYQLTIKG